MSNLFYNNILPVYKTFIVQKSNNSVPNNLVGITKAVANKVCWNINITGYENNFKIDNVEKNDKIMVGLSAGLDSVYLLQKLVDEGNEVIAVHIKGLNNMSRAEEYEQAKRIAKICGVKFIAIELNSPKQQFADNPFKNQLILSLMLDKGVQYGCYKFALGSDWTTPLKDGVIGFSITDTIEVNKEFWKDINTHWQQAELVFIDNNVKKKDRVQYLFNKNIDTFKNISSCVAPHRFKKYWKENNEKKYNIKLYNNRCGNCFKCCMEYLLLCELKLVEKNTAYYNHCWSILSNSKNTHRPDLFKDNIPLNERIKNLLDYGS